MKKSYARLLSFIAVPLFLSLSSCSETATFKVSIFNASAENLNEIQFGFFGNSRSPNPSFYLSNFTPGAVSPLFSMQRDPYESWPFFSSASPGFYITARNNYDPGFSLNSNGTTNRFTNSIVFHRGIAGYFNNEGIYLISIIQNPSNFYDPEKFKKTTNGVIELGYLDASSYISVQEKILWFYGERE